MMMIKKKIEGEVVDLIISVSLKSFEAAVPMATTTTTQEQTKEPAPRVA